MKRLVGKVVLPKSSHAKLLYHIEGDTTHGYELVVSKVVEETHEFVSKSYQDTMRLAGKIVRGAVFPDSLKEIIDDYRCYSDFD